MSRPVKDKAQDSGEQKKEKLVFAPCSEPQRIVLTDNTTDVILVGGGISVPPR